MADNQGFDLDGQFGRPRLSADGSGKHAQSWLDPNVASEPVTPAQFTGALGTSAFSRPAGVPESSEVPGAATVQSQIGEIAGIIPSSAETTRRIRYGTSVTCGRAGISQRLPPKTDIRVLFGYKP